MEDEDFGFGFDISVDGYRWQVTSSLVELRVAWGDSNHVILFKEINLNTMATRD